MNARLAGAMRDYRTAEHFAAELAAAEKAPLLKPRKRYGLIVLPVLCVALAIAVVV